MIYIKNRTYLQQAGAIYTDKTDLKRIKISVNRYDLRVATKSYLACKIKSETNPLFKVKLSAKIS
ncbi:MAG: hypothetical protein PHS59_15270 [Paludibacter sp.]|nr:hypothetical protein [Paludibacter sp.]